MSARSRPFVHAGWQFGAVAFEDDQIVAKEGNFGPIVVPTNTNDPENIQGLGTRVSAQVRNGWFAGIGLAVEVPWRDYKFRVLPSLDYYGEVLKLSGTSQRAAELVTPLVPGLGQRAEFRFERVAGNKEKTIHALGPRLGLEVEIGTKGPIVVSGFLEAAVFWFLGDREVVTRAQGEGSGTFSYKNDPMMIQGGVGLRFSWRPEGH